MRATGQAVIDEAAADPERGAFRVRGEQDRLTDFTDAAYAFAVTLLVIAAGDAPQTIDDLREAVRAIPASLVGFAHIVMFWRAHTRWHRRYGLVDRPALLLSLALIFLVLVYVFPLRLISVSLIEWLSGGALSATGADIGQTPDELRWLFGGYALTFTCLSSVLALLYGHALRLRSTLDLDDYETAETASDCFGFWGFAAVGSISFLTALWLPDSTVELGLPGWSFALLAVAPWCGGRLARRRYGSPQWPAL